jgi:predicted aminopeptidase
VSKRPGTINAETLRAEKQSVIDQLRQEYQQLKAQWGGYSGYDAWFQLPINNAQLNDVDTYYSLVPAFHRILRSNDGNWERFHQEVAHLAKLGKPERHRRLNGLLAENDGATIDSAGASK